MKKLLAALLAASMTFTLACCALPWDSSSSNSDSTAKSSSDAGSDSSKKDDSKSDESKKDDSKKDDSSKEEKKSKKEAKGNFEGTGYVLDIDDKKWENIKNEVANVDSAFRYIGDTSDKNIATSNFNIMVTSGAGDTKPADYVNVVKTQYSQLGYNVLDDSAMEFNGYDAHLLNVKMSQGDLTMLLNQVIMVENDPLYVISYGSEESAFKTVEPEFDSVLSTFAIK